MSAPQWLISIFAISLIWIQTAAAWHEVDHALHGHESDEIVCEILSGTADQPGDTAGASDSANTQTRSLNAILCTSAVRRDHANVYRSRAPPRC